MNKVTDNYALFSFHFFTKIEWHSPYYNESHRKFRAAVREFVDTELISNIHEWDEAKQLPREIMVKGFKAGILQILVGPPWPTQYGGSVVAGGIKPEEVDYFHELIAIDELCRVGSAGLQWGLSAGLSIALPAVMKFGSKYLQDLVCKPCLTGEKVICLAITEPDAGSDVAGLKTVATKTSDGKYYIVNGNKKWITNGVFADYFVTAVRTGSNKGHKGVSLLLIPRSKGVNTTQMKCQGE